MIFTLIYYLVYLFKLLKLYEIQFDFEFKKSNYLFKNFELLQ